MDPLYRETIMDHYQHPRHKGELTCPTVRQHDANPLCGDDLTLDLEIDSEGLIRACTFHGHGCAISQAAADMLCAEIMNRPAREILAMSKEEMLGILGIPLGPVRLKCALLAYKILKMALVKHLGQEGGSIDET
ncbi:MAG TPA: iron-sulfur cluster assembly scaffold protein [Thermoanaerobaculia bacterium]|nr:iron-sulfur cluster assembly scaffold protein [Thermoanaerobaculia bacterium]HUM28818.1 iron-sulfur cluster assembly scaffold protein [Thermoanaerobaculia bacterium]HXK69075.1 iron-sulfur cluster assembly scaffold protein [Thermoanaerobaculia bacterium]